MNANNNIAEKEWRHNKKAIVSVTSARIYYEIADWNGQGLICDVALKLGLFN